MRPAWLFLLLPVFAGLSQPVRAELPPSAYERFQREAPEALVIRVLAVTTRETREPENKRTDVTAEAQVERVVRSKAGLAIGDKIRLRYAREQGTRPGWVGPSPVPVLTEGAVCPAYLARGEQGNAYAPAAGGCSFRELK